MDEYEYREKLFAQLRSAENRLAVLAVQRREAEQALDDAVAQVKRLNDSLRLCEDRIKALEYEPKRDPFTGILCDAAADCIACGKCGPEPPDADHSDDVCDCGDPDCNRPIGHDVFDGRD